MQSERGVRRELIFLVPFPARLYIPSAPVPTRKNVERDCVPSIEHWAGNTWGEQYPSSNYTSPSQLCNGMAVACHDLPLTEKLVDYLLDFCIFFDVRSYFHPLDINCVVTLVGEVQSDLTQLTEVSAALDQVNTIQLLRETPYQYFRIS